MVTVSTFDNIIDANIALGRLQAEGVPCWLADANLVQVDMLYSPAVGGIKLQVNDEWAERARIILDTDYSDFDFPEAT